MTYITSGDMRYNPATNQWEPIAGNPMPPYVPAGADPAAGTGAVLTPTLDGAARAAHFAELRRQGLPVPDESPEPIVSLGGTRHVVEGPSLEELGAEVIDAQGDDLEGDPAPVDRIAELERKSDTDRPPRRRR